MFGQAVLLFALFILQTGDCLLGIFFQGCFAYGVTVNLFQQLGQPVQRLGDPFLFPPAIINTDSQGLHHRTLLSLCIS